MSWITTYVNQPGWNANASSIAVMEGDGRYEFQPGPAVGIIIGLAPSQTYGNMTGYTHAAWITGGSLKILTTPITPNLSTVYSFVCPVNATVCIQREFGQVSWWINGRLVFVSGKVSNGSVVLDAQLYSINDQIRNLTYIETDSVIDGDGSFSWRSQGSFEDWTADAGWKLTSTGYLIDYLGASSEWGYRSLGLWDEWIAKGVWALTGSAELLDALTATGNWGFNSLGQFDEWFAKGSWGYQGSGSFTPKIDMMVANGYWRFYSEGVVEDFTIITGDSTWSLKSFSTENDFVGHGSFSWNSSATVKSEALAALAFHLPSLVGIGYPYFGSVSRTFGYTLRLTQAQRFGYDSGTVLNLHQVTYAQAAQNLHVVSWTSFITNIAEGLHQTTWASAGSLNTVFSLHESSWASAGSLNIVAALHESNWASAGSLNTVVALHQTDWGSSALVTAIALHQTGWTSAGSLNTVAALHQSSWASAGSLNTVFSLHESSWASAGSLNTVFSMHQSSWAVSWTALGLQQASYQSVVETLNLHSIRYESVTDTILSLHECRYRSNQTTPIILTGLIYARI